MSFIKLFAKYLVDEEVRIEYVILYGEKNKDFPHTEIFTEGEKIKQVLYHPKSMDIPDKIAIPPTDVVGVEIGTSNGFIFRISKGEKPIMRINCTGTDNKGLGKKFVEAAIKLGYEVVL